MASPAVVRSAHTARFKTLADLQDHLWGIPAHRIRLLPAPGQATEKDLLDLQAHEDRIGELIDGTIVEKAVATFQSRLAAVLIFFLEHYLDEQPLGAVMDGSGFLRIAKGRVRAPDVAFVSWDRIAGDVFSRDPISDLVPDLAVEILSRSNTRREMDDYVTVNGQTKPPFGPWPNQ